MKIVFTNHAVFKLKLLKEHGFTITREMVANAIHSPDFMTKAKYGRKAAHKVHNGGLALRVVYEGDNDVVVVTVMIVRRERYERNKI